MSYHEPVETLDATTVDLHRALVSLQEELEAVDWYRQRADACGDKSLRGILVHNMREEIEHACMLLEWLRRNNLHFHGHMSTYLFAKGDILEAEAQADVETAHEATAEAEDLAPAPKPPPAMRLTIGSLKEDTLTDYLNRDAAGMPEALWKRIDQAAQTAAADLLTARRFLDLEGPFGVGLTSVETGSQQYCRPAQANAAGVVASRAIAVPALQQVFDLSIRRVEGHLRMGLPLELSPAREAAEAVARREEESSTTASRSWASRGCSTVANRQRLEIGGWDRVEQALSDVLAAVGRLDARGVPRSLQPGAVTGPLQRPVHAL